MHNKKQQCVEALKVVANAKLSEQRRHNNSRDSDSSTPLAEELAEGMEDVTPCNFWPSWASWLPNLGTSSATRAIRLPDQATGTKPLVTNILYQTRNERS